MNVATSIGSPTSWEIFAIWLDVYHEGTGRAVRRDGQLGLDDFSRERADAVHDARAGAGEADVRRRDAEVGHEMEQTDLCVHRGVDRRRGLKPVAKSLVIELDGHSRPIEPVAAIPIVHQRGFVHDQSLASGGGSVKDGCGSAQARGNMRASHEQRRRNARRAPCRICGSRPAGRNRPRHARTSSPLSTIPSPTGAERQRGLFVCDVMKSIGLDEVTIDDVGNVSGSLGRNGAAATAVLAHLDTVFGTETDVTVRRDGSRLSGAGICDNARGLAGMLALARAMAETEWRPARPILFVGTVGEEGAGDLRGGQAPLQYAADLRHGRGGPRRRRRQPRRTPGTRVATLSVHLSGPRWAFVGRVRHRKPGTRRGAIRVRHRGPRRAGPAADRVLGCANQRRAEPQYDPARDAGGHRPAKRRIIGDRHAGQRHYVAGADPPSMRRTPGRTRGSTHLDLSIDVIGDRPTGVTPATDPLVVAGVEATRLIGRRPALVAASTDANVPMALGIPVALGIRQSRSEPAATEERCISQRSGTKTKKVRWASFALPW